MFPVTNSTSASAGKDSTMMPPDLDIPVSSSPSEPSLGDFLSNRNGRAFVFPVFGQLRQQSGLTDISVDGVLLERRRFLDPNAASGTANSASEASQATVTPSDPSGSTSVGPKAIPAASLSDSDPSAFLVCPTPGFDGGFRATCVVNSKNPKALANARLAARVLCDLWNLWRYGADDHAADRVGQDMDVLRPFVRGYEVWTVKSEGGE